MIGDKLVASVASRERSEFLGEKVFFYYMPFYILNYKSCQFTTSLKLIQFTFDKNETILIQVVCFLKKINNP